MNEIAMTTLRSCPYKCASVDRNVCACAQAAAAETAAKEQATQDKMMSLQQRLAAAVAAKLQVRNAAANAENAASVTAAPLAHDACGPVKLTAVRAGRRWHSNGRAIVLLIYTEVCPV
jgi:hypothetical protein